MAADARSKRHSTRSEALDVARRMGAHRSILTHLSQRYSKQPGALLDSGGQGGIDSSFVVAFDLMVSAPHCFVTRLLPPSCPLRTPSPFTAPSTTPSLPHPYPLLP